MKTTIKSLCLLIILFSCNNNKGQNMDNHQGTQNSFVSKDSAIASVVQSLPQLLTATQKQLYDLSEADIKALAPGKDVGLTYISYSDIANATDSSLGNILPKEVSAVLVPLAVQNISRLFISIKSEKNNWQLQSVGNRKYLHALRDASNTANDAVVSVTGLEIDLIRKTGATGTMYAALETNKQAGFVKDSLYTDIVAMQKLKAYATYLSRQFGDKLKTGQLDR